MLRGRSRRTCSPARRSRCSSWTGRIRCATWRSERAPTPKPDPDYAFADKVGKKYGGVDLRKMDRPGERRVVVSLHPVKVNAIDLSRR